MPVAADESLIMLFMASQGLVIKLRRCFSTKLVFFLQFSSIFLDDEGGVTVGDEIVGSYKSCRKAMKKCLHAFHST